MMVLFAVARFAVRRTARCPHCGHELWFPTPDGPCYIACEHCLRLLRVTAEGKVRRDITDDPRAERLPLDLGKVTEKRIFRRYGPPERGGGGSDAKRDIPAHAGGRVHHLLRSLRTTLLALITLLVVFLATRSLTPVFRPVGHPVRGTLLEGTLSPARPVAGY